MYDLKPYDSSHAQPCELTAEEEKLEDLCNEERYLELHTDVAEKKLYEGNIIDVNNTHKIHVNS